MKASLTGGTIAFAAVLASATAAAGATLDGTWRNRKGTLDVLVAPCGAAYCGTVVAARGEAAAKASAGTRVIEGLTQGRDGVWRGRVYAADLHVRLGARIRILDADAIEITACALGGFLCDSNVWRRAPREGGPAAAAAR